MRVSPFIPLVLLAAVGCSRSALSPLGNLDGTWEWQLNRNPSGSSITLSLTTSSTMVSGAGTVCGVGPACSPGAVTITGQSVGTVFQLTIQGGSGFVATYRGRMTGRNEMNGVWTEANDSNTVILDRM